MDVSLDEVLFLLPGRRGLDEIRGFMTVEVRCRGVGCDVVAVVGCVAYGTQIARVMTRGATATPCCDISHLSVPHTTDAHSHTTHGLPCGRLAMTPFRVSVEMGG
mmetsp:Transcript_25814/g.60972  ORF Transcript_25814/g.60972 Transcript_25814/m.60972 type:complete len:105 (+) Transcript_25814:248-562(+)